MIESWPIICGWDGKEVCKSFCGHDKQDRLLVPCVLFSPSCEEKVHDAQICRDISCDNETKAKFTETSALIACKLTSMISLICEKNNLLLFVLLGTFLLAV